VLLVVIHARPFAAPSIIGIDGGRRERLRSIGRGEGSVHLDSGGYCTRRIRRAQLNFDGRGMALSLVSKGAGCCIIACGMQCFAKFAGDEV
jgi:hypothetical protein